MKNKVFRKSFRVILVMLVIAMALATPAFAKKKKKTVFKPQFVKTSLTLYSGDSYTLKLKKTAPKKPSYSTANKKVVMVGSKSKTGVKLTAKSVKKKTKVKITAKVGSKKTTCTVTVLPASQKPKTGGSNAHSGTTNTNTNTNNYNNNNTSSSQETGSVSNNNNSSSGGTTTTPTQPKPTYAEKYAITNVPSSTSMAYTDYINQAGASIGAAKRSYTYGNQGGDLVVNPSEVKVTSSSPYVRVNVDNNGVIHAAPQNIVCEFPGSNSKGEGKFPSASLPLTATITMKYKGVTKTTSVTVTDYANPTDKQLFSQWESMMKQETQVSNSNVSPIAKVVNAVKFSAKHYYYANPTPAGYPGTHQYNEWNCYYCFTQDYLNKVNTFNGTSYQLRNVGLSCITSTTLIEYIIKNYTNLSVTRMEQGGHVWCRVTLPDGRFINCDAGSYGDWSLPRPMDALLYSANGDPICSWGYGSGAQWNFTYETPNEMEAYIQVHPYN